MEQSRAVYTRIHCVTGYLLFNTGLTVCITLAGISLGMLAVRRHMGSLPWRILETHKIVRAAPAQGQ